MNSRSMQNCGFCSILRGLVRRALCIGSRRGSTESYYREIGDQETLKIEDRSSDMSEDTEEMNQETLVVPELHAQPAPSPEPASPDESLDLANMPTRKTPLGKFQTLHRRRKKLQADDEVVEQTGQLDDMYQYQIQNILARSTQWKFNAFVLETVSGGRGLPVLCMHLFHTYGLMSHYKLETVNMWKLFSLIQDNYHSNNPYHNSIHAADVTQAMHCFLQQTQILNHLEPLEILTSLLAAITHDVDHPGVNQPFLVGTSNHLATLYGNTSVLENHHWRIAMSCLIESCAFDHIPGMLATLQRRLRSMILATDITKQQNYLILFKNYLDLNSLDMKMSKHRHLVLQIALKCADISNPCRPWDISRMWSLKVCEEFFRQGDYERQLQVPVSLICDRHSTSIPKIQTTFFKYVVTPLIIEWHKFLQNDLSERMLGNLVFNLSKWETLVEQETAGETDATRADSFNACVPAENRATRSGSNMSDSTEMLVPPRRSSLNPAKQSSIKDQIRRFSAPLNVFQDTKHKNRDKGRASSVVESRSGSDTKPVCIEPKPSTSQKVLSSEQLIPESSIASLTTLGLATRLKSALKVNGTSTLIRQQTFPPMETASHAHAIVHRPLHTSNEEASSSNRFKIDLADKIKYGKSKGGDFAGIFKRNDKKTDIDEITEMVDETYTVDDSANLVPKGATGRRDSATVGSQLRENLFSIQLGALESDQLMQRRKSMPAEGVANTLKEKVIREVPVAVPQFLHRALSSKESWTRRRGSAPSPVAPSELRGLAGPGAMSHSVSGGRRKLSPISSCQQWHAKTTYNVQEKTFVQLPRRSSLPVEESHHTETMKTSKSN